MESETELYKKTAGIYDFMYEEMRDTKFWTHLAHQHGGPVLEIGCGTGRILLELAKAGFDVTGIDISPDMLAVLKRKLKKLPKGLQEQVKVKEADMRNFALGRMFRTVIIPFSAFQHLLTTKEQQACLKAVHMHLLDRGTLVIDVFNPDLSRPKGVLEHQWTRQDRTGRTVSKFSSQTYNPTTQISNQHFFIDITDRLGRLSRITASFRLRYVFYKDIKKLLESTGFRIVEVYGSFNREKFSEKHSQRIIAVASKVG